MKKALIAAMIALAIAGIGEQNKREMAEKNMDRQALCFDADGPVMLIDTDLGLIGLYNSDAPVYHAWDHVCMQPGHYTLGDRTDEKLKGMAPDGTPVVVK